MFQVDYRSIKDVVENFGVELRQVNLCRGLNRRFLLWLADLARHCPLFDSSTAHACNSSQLAEHALSFPPVVQCDRFALPDLISLQVARCNTG